MQLTVREVCGHLNVSESTVIRWIKQKNLPARQVGGQYRVNRTELLEWATSKQVKISLALFDRPEEEPETIPSLEEALTVGGIHYQLKDTDKARALRALIQVLPLPENVDRELLLRLFMAREDSASTAVGDGIAIPHVRNPIVLNVTRPSITLAFLTRPIDFGALDGKPVQILFSLVSPTNRSHLQLLSRLSFALHDEGFREALKNQVAAEKIIQEVRRVETGMRKGTGNVKKGAQ